MMRVQGVITMKKLDWLNEKIVMDTMESKMLRRILTYQIHPRRPGGAGCIRG